MNTEFFDASHKSNDDRINEAKAKAEKADGRTSVIELDVLKQYDEASHKTLERQKEMRASSLSKVAHWFATALLDSRPQARYVVGNDANTGVHLFMLFPEDLTDPLTSMLQK